MPNPYSSYIILTKPYSNLLSSKAKISQSSMAATLSLTHQTPSRQSTPTPTKKPQANTIGLYAVQCGECMKWRLLSTEEEYEDIRCKLLEEPFKCSNKPNVTCDDPTDIEKDATRTWVLDKPNIPKTPSGFKRKLILRRDYSKLDAHYISPTGKKLRSTTEVARFLEESKLEGVSVSDFSFTVPKVVEETVPKEVTEKKASSVKDKKSKD